MEQKYEINHWTFDRVFSAGNNNEADTIFVYRAINARGMLCGELKVHSFKELSEYAMSHDPYRKSVVI